MNLMLFLLSSDENTVTTDSLEPLFWFLLKHQAVLSILL